MTLAEILDFELIKINKYSIKLYSVLIAIVYLAVVYFSIYLIRKLIYRSKKLDLSTKFTIFTLAKYFLYVLSFVVVLEIFGISPNVLLASSAALLVGIGMGLQNLFSDFVSGIILLFDSSIKVGDIIEVDGMISEVKQIKLRTTTVLSREDVDIILPNTILVSNKVINWTHNMEKARFDIEVGVGYDSDVNLVMDILKRETQNHPGTDILPEPFVLFENYADSALIFKVYFWSHEIFTINRTKSELRIAFFEEFRKNNIEIPFPQRVVTLKENS